jgi:hypothetical protein
MLHARNEYPVFGRGGLKWIELTNEDGLADDSVMAYYRSFGNREVLIIQNLSPGKKTLEWTIPFRVSLLGKTPVIKDSLLELNGFDYLWLLI